MFFASHSDAKLVRIRRPEIGELAHQAKGVRIFAGGEIPGFFAAHSDAKTGSHSPPKRQLSTAAIKANSRSESERALLLLVGNTSIFVERFENMPRHSEKNKTVCEAIEKLPTTEEFIPLYIEILSHTTSP